MTFNWLMLAHFKNPKERLGCYKHIEGTRVKPGVKVFVAMFGPNINSPVQLAQITSEGVEYVGVMDYGRQGTGYYTKYVPKVKKLVKTFLDNNIKIHGVDFYMHSAGILVGDGWYHKRNFLTIMDVVDHVFQPLQPRVVIFDSCYMGVLSALYEISKVKSIYWVMASPSYHPSFSVLETDAFGKVGTTSHDKDTLGKQLARISCDFQALTYPSYRCFILFDIRKIPKFVQELKHVGPQMLRFSKETQLSAADKVTHDLWRASTDPYLKSLIKDIVKDTCGLKHCKVARGMSIEITYPDAHLGLFKSTRWYKEMKGLLYD
jgi:hypothetical protein